MEIETQRAGAQDNAMKTLHNAQAHVVYEARGCTYYLDLYWSHSDSTGDKFAVEVESYGKHGCNWTGTAPLGSDDRVIDVVREARTQAMSK